MASYQEAMLLVEQLMCVDAACVKNARQQEPTIGRLTSAHLLAVTPALDATFAERLAQPFAY